MNTPFELFQPVCSFHFDLPIKAHHAATCLRLVANGMYPSDAWDIVTKDLIPVNSH